LAQWLAGMLALGVVADAFAALTGLRYLGVLDELLDPNGSVSEQQVLDVEATYGGWGSCRRWSSSPPVCCS
jgi:hypothetical protein